MSEAKEVVTNAATASAEPASAGLSTVTSESAGSGMGHDATEAAASAAPSEVKRNEVESDSAAQEARRKCKEYRDKALESDKVKIIREGMEKLGCDFPMPDFFRCQPCENEGIIGAFSPAKDDEKAHVVLCEDNISKFQVSAKHVERTAAHELVHAYDTCRAKVDWHNCLHLACTEVRAANLSGDCTMGAEMGRGQFSVKGQGERCVRRRAELSVAGHEHCKDIAKAAVEKVFDRCLSDRAPFIGKFY